MSLKRPRDQLLPWFRRHDVRTDDAIHRPREMRLSCQLKAVGFGGDPDNPSNLPVVDQHDQIGKIIIAQRSDSEPHEYADHCRCSRDCDPRAG